eukprot:TRINITY_DN19646_c0_g1_i1.p1 TRINITY_DN19646_c0_g1~~TRINITY_DN19646_c0_g1_i1.p1  ORF type:complete len:2831 (+),score=950.97 TRINITY_DN19646_c0_g1_i1:70-8562(+)
MRRGEASAKKKDGKDEVAAQAVLQLLSGADEGAEELTTLVMRQVATLSGEELRSALRGSARLLKDLGTSQQPKKRRACVAGCRAVLESLATLNVGEQETVIRDHVVFLHQALLHVLHAADDHADVQDAAHVCAAALLLAATGSIAGDLVMALVYRATEWLASVSPYQAHAGAAMIAEVSGPLAHLFTPYLYMASRGLRKALDIDSLEVAEAVAGAMAALFPQKPTTTEARRTADYLLTDVADAVRKTGAQGRVVARGAFLALAALVKPLKDVWKLELQVSIAESAMKAASATAKQRDPARPAAVRLVGRLAQHNLLASSASVCDLLASLVALVETADGGSDDPAVPSAFLAIAALLETDGDGVDAKSTVGHSRNTSFALAALTPRGSPRGGRTPRQSGSAGALDALDDDVRQREHASIISPTVAPIDPGRSLGVVPAGLLDSPPALTLSSLLCPALTPRAPLSSHELPHELPADDNAPAALRRVLSWFPQVDRLWAAASHALIHACLPAHLRGSTGGRSLKLSEGGRQKEVAYAAAACIGALLPIARPPDVVYVKYTAALQDLHLYPALVSILSHLAQVSPSHRELWTQLIFHRAQQTLTDTQTPHELLVETLQALLNGALFLQGVDIVRFAEQCVVPLLGSVSVAVRRAAVELACLLAAATANAPPLPLPSLDLLQEAARTLDAASATPREQRDVLNQLAAARLYVPPHVRGLHLQIKNCHGHVRQLLSDSASADIATRSWSTTFQSVLAMAVGDPLASCRIHAWRNMWTHSNRLLKLYAGPCVQSVCLSLSDDNEEVQALALALCVKLCRVSSVVAPRLRAVLLREWTMVHHSRDPLQQARSARVFCIAHHALGKSSPELMPRELMEETMATMVVRTLDSSVPLVQAALFDVLSHLLGVAIPMPAETVAELESIAIEAIVDGTAETTKPAAYCLSQVLQRSGRVGMQLVDEFPDLLPRLLELLRALGERSDVRVAVMRLLGVMGALSPKKIEKVLQHPDASGTTPWHQQRWWRTITHSQYPSYRVVGALLTILGQPRHRIHHRAALLALQSPLGLLGQVKMHELSKDVLPVVISVAQETYLWDENWDWVPPFRAALQTLKFVLELMPSHVDPRLLPALQKVCEHAVEAGDERLSIPALNLIETLAAKLGPLFRPAAEGLLPHIIELLSTTRGADVLFAATDCLKAITPSFLLPYTKLIAHKLCRCLAVDAQDVKGGVQLAARCLAALDNLVVQRLGGQEVLPTLVQTLRRMLDSAQRECQSPPASPVTVGTNIHGKASSGFNGAMTGTAGQQPLTMLDVWRMCVELLGKMARFLSKFAGGSLRDSIFHAVLQDVEASALAMGVTLNEARVLYEGSSSRPALSSDPARKDLTTEETPYKIDNTAVLRATQPSATPKLWLDGLAQTLLGENPRRALKTASSVARLYTPLAYELLPAAFIAFAAEPRRLEYYQHDAMKKLSASSPHVSMLKTLKKDATDTLNHLIVSLREVLRSRDPDAAHATSHPDDDDVSRRVLELAEVYERYEEGVAAVRPDGAPNVIPKTYFVLSPLRLCKTAQSVGLHAKAVHWGEATLLRPNTRDESTRRVRQNTAPLDNGAGHDPSHEVDVEACRALVHSCRYLGIDGIEAGVLHLLERRHRGDVSQHDNAKLQENLGNYDKALELYRVAGDTPSVIRLLTRLGYWRDIVREAGCKDGNNALQHHPTVARCVARAAWILGDWDQLDAAAEKMHAAAHQANADRAGGAQALVEFYRALVHTQKGDFTVARDRINSCRVQLESELSTTLADTYVRSYDTMVSLQQLVELEEIIDFKEAAVDAPPTQDGLLAKLKQTWAARIEQNEVDPTSLRGTLALRSLLIPPADDVKPWLKFVEACTGPHRRQLARDVLSMLAGLQGGVEAATVFPPEFLQHSEVALTTVRFLWDEAVQRQAGAPSDKAYHSTLRKLVGDVQRVADMAKDKDEAATAQRRMMADCLVTALEWRRHLKDANHEDLMAMFEPALNVGEHLMPADVTAACTPPMAALRRHVRSAPASRFGTEIRRSASSLHAGESPRPRRLESRTLRSPRPVMLDGHTPPTSARGPRSLLGSKESLDDPCEPAAAEVVDAAEQARGLATAKRIWKSWAMLCSAAARERKSPKYGMEAMRGFINYVRCCGGGETHDQTAVAMVLRLLDLVFLFTNDRDVRAYAAENLRTVPALLWLSVVPQLVARLGGEATAVVRDLLLFVAETCPHSVVYSLLPPCYTDEAPATAGKSGDPSGVPQRQQASRKVLDHIRARNDKLVAHAELLVTELTQTAVLEAERWAMALEDAYTRSKGDPLKVLAANYARLREKSTEADTLDRNRFVHLCGKGLFEAETLWKDKRESSNARGWEAARSVYKEIERLREAMIKRGVHLEAVAPRLAAAKGLELAIPGWKMQSAEGNDPPLIHTFAHSLSVFQTKTTPKKLSIVDSHGATHDYLLKGHEDLRLDERVMQLLGLVRNLLHQTDANGDIVGYPVVPLSGNVGLLGWVQGADDLGKIIRSERHPQMALHETNMIRKFARLRCMEDWDTCPLTTRVKALQQVAEVTDGDDIHRYLWLQSSQAETWVRRRSAYCRSLAGMSMVGFVLGLGDRHVGNMLLQKATGRVIHIDFGDCFDIARERARFAEKVPFRLTRQLRHATGVGGSRGMFYHTAVATMGSLRDGRDLVMSMLEAFVYDPLIQWRLEAPQVPAEVPTAPAAKPARDDAAAAEPDLLGPEEIGVSHASVKRLMLRLPTGTVPKERADAQRASNDKAQHVVQRVLQKLTGEDAAEGGGTGEHVLAQSVNDQVSRLIDEATSLQNLAQAFRGWQPWL